MKIKKKIEIIVEYESDDEVGGPGDIDFTRIENFDNFNFKHDVKIIDVKEEEVDEY